MIGPNPSGLCKCGCGGTTTLATRSRKGLVEGESVNFLPGHNVRGENSPFWNGGSFIKKGYTNTLISPGVYELDHVAVAERALGKKLPKGAVVHHVDEDRSNNANNNLVICQDNAYHRIIHRRLRAFKATGHADWRRCHLCKKYDSLDNLLKSMRGDDSESFSTYHQDCMVTVRAARKALKNEI